MNSDTPGAAEARERAVFDAWWTQQIKSAWFRAREPDSMAYLAYVFAKREAAAEIAAARAEVEALRKDAERYRWLRADPSMLLHLKNSEFDAAIDNAMKEKP